MTPHVVKQVALVDAELEIGLTELEEAHFEGTEVHTDPSAGGEDTEGDVATVEEIHVDGGVVPEANEESPTFETTEKPDEPKKAKPSFKSAAKPLVVEEPNKEEVKPDIEKPVEPVVQKKKISFEITNPDDIKIDEKGQGSLF